MYLIYYLLCISGNPRISVSVFLQAYICETPTACPNLGQAHDFFYSPPNLLIFCSFSHHDNHPKVLVPHAVNEYINRWTLSILGTLRCTNCPLEASSK